MPCIWNDARYSEPPSRVKVIAKYNIVRSDIPFEYVVAHFDLSWRTWYMMDGHLMESIIPKPDWWALIEAEDDHA
jgi:hypothetical protein